MYSIVAIASVIIRNFFIPNPFESLQNGFVINLAFEPVLWLATYFVVSLFYEKGSFPALGSGLYLLFYYIHVKLISYFGVYNFALPAIVIISFLYFFIIFCIASLKESIISR